MNDVKAKNELPACPVETTLTLIGDKWKVLILRDLMPGTKRSQILSVTFSMGCSPGVQLLKSPTMETALACGAQTRNTAPASPFSSHRCAPK